MNWKILIRYFQRYYPNVSTKVVSMKTKVLEMRSPTSWKSVSNYSIITFCGCWNDLYHLVSCVVLLLGKYNVPHGKKNRGVSVVTSFRCLVSNPTEDELYKARLLGWCIEWLQGYFLVADDIMDHSLTRRGQPCWYKNDNIGMMAINDSFYLEAAIYKILKKYFRNEPYYIDVVELFHETTMQTVVGQGLDLLTAEDEKVDFSKFSMERYNAIVTWKTAYYSFYLPVALAMHMAGVKDVSISHQYLPGMDTPWGLQIDKICQSNTYALIIASHANMICVQLPPLVLSPPSPHSPPLSLPLFPLSTWQCKYAVPLRHR